MPTELTPEQVQAIDDWRDIGPLAKSHEAIRADRDALRAENAKLTAELANFANDHWHNMALATAEQLAAREVENAKLTAERSDLADALGGMNANLQSCESALAEARQRIERLEAALRPFASRSEECRKLAGTVAGVAGCSRIQPVPVEWLIRAAALFAGDKENTK